MLDVGYAVSKNFSGGYMLKIGEFSKLSRVSVRMLRHYDEIGLLCPARIDPDTEYRYYRADQLPVVGRITSLKDMGFSLADIARILAVYDDPAAMERYFAAREAELRELAEITAYRLTLLETARKRLRKDEPMMQYNVTIRTLPTRYAATVRMTIPRYQDEGMVWGVLCEETAQMHLVPDEPCYCSVVFHDGEFKEENVEVEAQKTVRGTYPDTEHVKFRTLPPVTYAGCTFKGSYAQIDEVVAAVSAWIEENGYEPDGEMFDIYHVSPHETDNPDEFVTEVCFPVKKG